MAQLDWKDPLFLQRIEVEKVDDYFKVMIDGSAVCFNTPMMRVPFGLDKKYNVIQIKLQCLTEEEDADPFIDFLESLESRLLQLTGIPRSSLSTFIIRNNGYQPLITSKIITNRGGNIGTELVNTAGEHQNLFNIEKGDHLKIRMMIDSIRPYNGKFWYKLKAKKIVCV